MPGKVGFGVDRGVAILTIENPGRMNAMDDAVAAGLADGVAAARETGEVGALVLRGAGGEAFCAGVDLKFAAEHPDRAQGFAKVGRNLDLFHKGMEELPFPSIALIHGVCYGGGIHLAVSCDFRFAATSLRLAIPAVKNGLLYPIPALDRLMRLVGPSRTRRLVLEGAPVPAETLLAWGLLDEVHPADALDEKALAFARHLAGQPRKTIPTYMKILRAVEAGDLETAEKLRAAARQGPG